MYTYLFWFCLVVLLLCFPIAAAGVLVIWFIAWLFMRRRIT